MRTIAIYAAIVLTGCVQEPASEQISFDGADYSSEDEKIAHGERLATILSCVGCHELDLSGAPFAEDMAPGIYASNLTIEVPKRTDEELDQAIRGGIHPERGDIWIMPSEAFQYLSDRDAEAIIAFLRTVPKAGVVLPQTNIPPEYLVELRRDVGPARERVVLARRNPPVDLGEKHEYGRRLTMIACAKCHESDLTGEEGFSPDLLIAGAYSREQLISMLTTGEGLAGRDIGLMGTMGGQRFNRLTKREREAIADYVLAHVEARLAE